MCGRGWNGLTVWSRVFGDCAQWLTVAENIAGFGGDKDKVTIYGESSGGLAVELLAHAYGGQNSGLFRAGMISSVTAFSPFMTTIARQEGYFAELANVTGCDMQIDILQCLRDCMVQPFIPTIQCCH